MPKMKIAWIEDDADEIAAVVKPLRKAGFDIKVYRTYTEVKDKINELRNCNLILLDLIIPMGGSADTDPYLGKKLLQELREDHGLDVPVIVFSVVAEVTFSEDEKNDLKVRLLSKPVRPSVLKEEVFKLLRLPPEE